MRYISPALTEQTGSRNVRNWQENSHLPKSFPGLKAGRYISPESTLTH